MIVFGEQRIDRRTQLKEVPCIAAFCRNHHRAWQAVPFVPTTGLVAIGLDVKRQAGFAGAYPP